MKHQRRAATWVGVVLGSLCAVLLAAQAQAESHAYTEEFHQTYALASGGRIELHNINGPVHISGWDRDEVKVDAVKYAGTKRRLDEMKIDIDATRNSISIQTRYPSRNLTFDDDERDNPGGVEYTLMVPRSARLDEVKLINGAFDISGVSGEVRGSCVNGRLTARDLAGRTELSTVNGRLEADFASLSSSTVELSSVNGGLDVTLPSDARAEVEASTVLGGISNDFGLRVISHRYVGHELHGELAGGGARIRLKNVNGHIDIRHANDSRAMSPVRELSHDDDKDKDDDDDDI